MQLKKLIFLASAAFIAAACTFEDSQCETQQEKKNAVRFALSVPGVATPTASARSLTDLQEKTVSTVDVLVFYTQGTHAGTLYRREQATPVAGNTFEIDLPQGTYNLVVLGNATSIVNGTAGLVPESITQTAALASLMHTNTGEWATPTIPMWGYANNVIVDANTSLTGANAINMHRMVSKIDVQLSTAAAGEGNSNFQLTSVRLYNYNTKGRLAPDMSNWNATGGVVNAGKGIATAPTIPTNPGAVTGENNPLLFNATHGLTANHLLNTIYTFEATNGTAQTLTTNPCLVIGGRYLGGSETYYRVDFIKKVQDQDDEFLNLLRNHRYLFTINSVAGEGRDTPEEAFNGGSFNMEANVLQWEEGDITDIVFDGQNFLGVSQGTFDLTSDARAASSTDNKLKIRTDVPGGWTATVWADKAGTQPVPNDGVTGNPWLRLSDTSGTGGIDPADVMSLNMDLNTSGGGRTAYVHLKAGRLTYIIPVTQQFHRLKITDMTTGEEITTISFPSKKSLIGVAPAYRQVKVEWSPSSETVSVVNTPGATELTWGTAYPVTLTDGLYVIRIDPDGIAQSELDVDPFISKSTRLTFMLGSTGITASLDIEQAHYNLDATNFTDITASVLNGNGIVKSNAPWSVSWSANLDNGSMTAPTTQPITEVGSTSGTPFPYTFTTGSDGVVSFTFTPTDSGKLFDPVTVTINAMPVPYVDLIMLPDGGNANATGARYYAGAFWKNNQTGERVITIPTPTEEYHGNWAVQVLVYGEDFKKGDIVFLPGGSANLAADAETQQVNSTKAYAIGSGTSTDGFKFRIGLTSQWNETNPHYNPARPVRYARVAVSFGNNDFQYRRAIFIRQGDAPDYLMRPQDNDGTQSITTDWGGDATAPRSKARKFTPYNLTAPTLKNTANTTASALAAIQGSPAENYFTNYPTQAGAFYQFTPTYGVYAFNPGAPTSKPNNWGTDVDQTNFWDTLKATMETCPAGYRRPNDGETDVTPTRAVSISEIRQSLWLNPPSGNTRNTENYVKGFYADGYFERKTLGTQDAVSSSAPNVAVSVNTSHVAYWGALFFNPYNHNSIFFPIIGYRQYNSINTTTGALTYTGSDGFYWTSSTNSTIGVNAGSATQLSPSYGLPIRCVVAE